MSSNSKFYSSEKYLDFRDVLVLPRFSELNSRSDVELESTLRFRNGVCWTGIPIVAANMTTTGTFEVYKVLSRNKIITAFNKFYTVDDYNMFIKYNILDPDYFMVSTGIGEHDLLNLDTIMSAIECKFICIDIANGYIDRFYHFCREVRQKYPDKVIVAGNVVTGEAVQLLSSIGIDIVKIGIGPGSACTTRIQTGIGMPQLSCVLKAVETIRDVDSLNNPNNPNDTTTACTTGTFIMSDGGITCPGDCVKAYVAGAHFIMIGGEFAGHDENPGSIIEENGEQYKLFYGMSSQYAMKHNYTDGNKLYRSSEGRVIKVKYRGSLQKTVDNYLGGIRSACTYTNSRTLKQLSKNGEFIMVNNQYNSHLLRP